MRSRCGECGRDGRPAVIRRHYKIITPVLCISSPSTRLSARARARAESERERAARSAASVLAWLGAAPSLASRDSAPRFLHFSQYTCDRSRLRTDYRHATRANLTLLRSFIATDRVDSANSLPVSSR